MYCIRCRGRLFHNSDEYGTFYQCIHCGYIHDIYIIFTGYTKIKGTSYTLNIPSDIRRKLDRTTFMEVGV